ncbi:hypothetical protein DXA98_13895 [Lachnospiraceae bacterium OF09-6]|nr:hypothetical protein DXA98_13895 [Lachnospiraceae bacterium OF09-6]
MFEDFGKKLSVFGQQMVKKTGEVAEIASLKTKTLAKKKKIQDELLALGKAYYEEHKDEITEYEDKITAINTIYTELECLEEEMKALKEKLPEGMDAEEDIFEDEEGTVAEETVPEESSEEAAPAEEAVSEESSEEAAPAEEAVSEESSEKTAPAEEAATEESNEE